MDNFARAIRSARLTRQLSQGQVAERAGVSLATVQNLEAGRANPSLSTLVAICQTLGLEVITRSAATRDIASQLSGLGVPLLDPSGHEALRPSRERLIHELNAISIHLKKLRAREESALASFLWALRDHYPSVWCRMDAPIEEWLSRRDQQTLSVKLRRLAVSALSQYL